MYFEMFGQIKKTLAQLDKWLEAAAAHATATARRRTIDPQITTDGNGGSRAPSR